MEIRKISLGLAAAALLGATPVMAAAPITPSVARVSAPGIGTNLVAGSRLGAPRAAKSSNVAAAGAAVIAALAAAAAVGGVVAATDNGGHSSTSP